MNGRAVDRVHAPGRAARTPFYPTHRVRARHTHSVQWVARGSQWMTACTACSLNVQSFADSALRAGAALGWPRDRTNDPAHPVQELVK